MESYASLVHYSTYTVWSSVLTKSQEKDKASHPQDVLSNTLIVVSTHIDCYYVLLVLFFHEIYYNPEVSVWSVELVPVTVETKLPSFILIDEATNIVFLTKQLSEFYCVN